MVLTSTEGLDLGYIQPAIVVSADSPKQPICASTCHRSECSWRAYLTCDAFAQVWRSRANHAPQLHLKQQRLRYVNTPQTSYSRTWREGHIHADAAYIILTGQCTASHVCRLPLTPGGCFERRWASPADCIEPY